MILPGQRAFPLQRSVRFPAGVQSAAVGAPGCAGTDAPYQFENSLEWLENRFGRHPFRQYRFAFCVNQLVVYRTFRWRGLPAASLLTVYSAQVDLTLRRWLSSLQRDGVYLIHFLGSPTAAVGAALKRGTFTLPQPVTRNPYYLTAKPINVDAHQTRDLFEFGRWDCTGGDVL